jgi:hypothetical protein
VRPRTDTELQNWISFMLSDIFTLEFQGLVSTARFIVNIQRPRLQPALANAASGFPSVVFLNIESLDSTYAHARATP